MRERTPRGRARGLSLIEVLVTMALLSIVLLALAPLFTQSVNVNASSNQLSTANSLAREKLEELLLYPTTDTRMAVTALTGKGEFGNDLPLFYQPSTGATSKSTTSPGVGWLPYPFEREYTVEPFVGGVAMTPPTSPIVEDESVYGLPGAGRPYYDVKLITVRVTPTGGPFPGLRRTTQSAYARYRNASPN